MIQRNFVEVDDVLEVPLPASRRPASSLNGDGFFPEHDDFGQRAQRTVHRLGIGERLRYIRLQDHHIRSLRVTPRILSHRCAGEVIFGLHFRLSRLAVCFLHNFYVLCGSRAAR